MSKKPRHFEPYVGWFCRVCNTQTNYGVLCRTCRAEQRRLEAWDAQEAEPDERKS